MSFLGIWAESLIIFFVIEPMRAFPGFDKVIKVEASSKPIDLIAVFIDNISGVVYWGVKINCVSLVAADKRGVVELITHVLRVLAEGLVVWVVVLLVVAHVVDVVVGIWSVVLVSLTGVFEFSDLEGLLDEDVFDVVRQVIDFILGLVVVVFVFGFADALAFEIFCLDFVKKPELGSADNSLWLFWIFAIGILVVVVFHVVFVFLAFLGLESQRKVAH